MYAHVCMCVCCVYNVHIHAYVCDTHVSRYLCVCVFVHVEAWDLYWECPSITPHLTLFTKVEFLTWIQAHQYGKSC